MPDVCACYCHICESMAGTCCRELYPLLDFSETEAAKLAEFEDAEAAPESYVRQHRSESDCWCQPYRVGTLGVWTHRMGEDS